MEAEQYVECHNVEAELHESCEIQHVTVWRLSGINYVECHSVEVKMNE